MVLDRDKSPAEIRKIKEEFTIGVIGLFKDDEIPEGWTEIQIPPKYKIDKTSLFNL